MHKKSTNFFATVDGGGLSHYIIGTVVDRNLWFACDVLGRSDITFKIESKNFIAIIFFESLFLNLKVKFYFRRFRRNTVGRRQIPYARGRIPCR